MSVPTHVAIIMDGNGRWAAQRGWARIKGHKAGVQAVERILEAASDAGIRHLSLYAFSTENSSPRWVSVHMACSDCRLVVFPDRPGP